MTPREELARLAREATPGEWRAGRMDMVSYGGDGEGPFKNVYVDDPRGGIHEPTGHALGYVVASGHGDEDECRANAAFIAAANPAAILALLARLEAAERERDEARDCGGQACGDCRVCLRTMLAAANR